MSNFSTKRTPAEVDAENILAEKVIYGHFYTVDKKQPRAEAVAISGGHFVYVGDAEGVKEFIGDKNIG